MSRYSLTMFASLTLCAVAYGQYEIPWHTVAGGGACPPNGSVGGTYELSGTIGQHDAGSATAPLAGGTFTMVGGYWTIATPVVPPACVCPGDMNIDGLKNGGDIQNFVTCMVAGGDCACADVDAAPGLSFDDVTAFIADLLNEVPCP